MPKINQPMEMGEQLRRMVEMCAVNALCPGMQSFSIIESLLVRLSRDLGLREIEGESYVAEFQVLMTNRVSVVGPITYRRKVPA